MNVPFTSQHLLDKDGKPAGGWSESHAISIEWQNGPLGRGEDRVEPNGAFVETVIAIAVDRLQFYQDNGFACDENAEAIKSLNAALDALNARTARREAEGTEGTHDGR